MKQNGYQQPLFCALGCCHGSQTNFSNSLVTGGGVADFGRGHGARVADSPRRAPAIPARRGSLEPPLRAARGQQRRPFEPDSDETLTRTGSLPPHPSRAVRNLVGR